MSTKLRDARVVSADFTADTDWAEASATLSAGDGPKAAELLTRFNARLTAAILADREAVREACAVAARRPDCIRNDATHADDGWSCACKEASSRVRALDLTDGT